MAVRTLTVPSSSTGPCSAFPAFGTASCHQAHGKFHFTSLSSTTACDSKYHNLYPQQEGEKGVCSKPTVYWVPALAIFGPHTGSSVCVSSTINSGHTDVIHTLEELSRVRWVYLGQRNHLTAIPSRD